jgi:prepilin-type processing-associated H-X9-DG protein
MRPKQPRGFALAEVLAVVIVALMMIGLMLPAARHARSAGWDVLDAENLHRFAAATTAYAADNGDLYWTFSWRADMDLPTDYEDLKPMNYSDLGAANAQAVDILRRVGGREEIKPINNWWAHAYYSQLPLYDYLDNAMPALWGICPADRIRLMWAKDPQAFDRGEFLPCQPVPSNDSKRWPYSSSYELSTSFFDQSIEGARVTQAEAHNLYSVPGNAQLHARTLGQTAHPSQKVHLYELRAHHTDEDVPDRCESARLWIYPDSRIAMLFADGHAAMSTTGEANPGWQPNFPADPDPTCVWDLDGGCYPGVYRWTRNYLAGRDFGGPEVGPP